MPHAVQALHANPPSHLTPVLPSNQPRACYVHAATANSKHIPHYTFQTSNQGLQLGQRLQQHSCVAHYTFIKHSLQLGQGLAVHDGLQHGLPSRPCLSAVQR
jgi:hypothetical protein